MKRLVFALFLIGMATNANAHGMDRRTLEFIFLSALVDACAEARPALAQRLRSGYAQWLASLSTEDRKARQEADSTDDDRKMRAELGRQIRESSEKEVTKSCEDLIAHLYGKKDIFQ